MNTPDSTRQDSYIPERLVITVHGIRTFGAWQDKLESQLRTELGRTVEVAHYRYGFFTLLAFLIPPLRWLATKRFQSELSQATDRHDWSRIDVIAHSFGTHLVGWGLLRLQKQQRPLIHTVIFAGSVLKRSFPIRDLIGARVTRLINDCGTKDNVLLANQMFVLFTGMAGRVGFSGMEGDSFRNRYFQFGHGGYFAKGEPGKLDFISEYWLPLLLWTNNIKPHDARQMNRFDDLTALTLNNAEPIKLMCYVSPMLALLFYINSLRVEAVHQAGIAHSRQLDALQQALIARSRQIAAQSRQADDSKLDLGLLLSIESGRIAETAESRGALFSGARANPQLSTYLHHPGSVSRIVFTSDGRELISVQSDNTIYRWDVQTRRRLGEPLKFPLGLHLNLSPDGKLIAYATDEGVVIWDISSNRPLGGPLPNTEKSHGMAFDPSSDMLAVAETDYQTVQFVNPRTRQVLGKPIRSDLGVEKIAISQAGQILALGTSQGAITLWDLVDRQQLGPPMKVQSARVNAMAFSPDGKILVSTFGDTLSLYRHNDLQIWDVATQQPVGSPLKGHESDITRIAFGKSGSRFASASDDGTVRLWDAATGLSLGGPLRGHEYTVEDIVFSPDGITLASAGDNNVLLWDVDKSDNLTSQADNPPNQGEVRSVAFSFDGKMLASGAEDGLILWDVRGHHVRKPVHPASREVSGEVTCVTFSPSGHLLGSSNSQGMVQLLDTTTVDPLGTPFAGGCVSFSPDGRLIASTTDERTVTLRDQSTHQPFGKPLTMQRAVTHLAFNPSGTVLATASFEDPPAGGGLWSGNGIIRLWNVMTQKEMGQPLRGHGDVVNFVTFSHDGKLLASASDDGTVRLWDAATGLSLGEPLRGHRNGVTSAAFSPDGKTLASASADATVRLWDLLTRQPLGDPIRISNFAVNAVAFSPDGNLLASAGADDDGVWLWDVNPTSWASRACIRANRNLTLQEWRVYIGGDRPYHKTCPNLPYPETTMDY